MKPADFLQDYKKNQTLTKLSSLLRDNRLARARISGMAGSSPALTVAATFKSIPNPHIIVTSSREEAAYFFNDLENLLDQVDMPSEKRNIFLFPSAYKKPYQTIDQDTAGIAMRSEIINRLAGGENRFILVTYPEGITEKIISGDVVKQNILTLNNSEEVSVDFILELLLEYGFYRVDFVVEPGQFSLRGGIVDVFSYAADYPYRIEIMGDQVESLRSFNPESQISVEKLDRISVLPDISQLGKKEESVSLFKNLPAETIIWFDDVFFLMEKLKDAHKKIHTHKNINSEIQQDTPDIIPESGFLEETGQFNIVEYRRHFLCEQDTDIFEFHFSPQPSFNKNFKLLISDLKEKTKKKYTNYLLSDNPRQINRIHSIFDNLREQDSTISGFNHETMGVSLHEGFIDRVNKVCFYTDHQIFERYHRYRIREKFPGKKAMSLKEINNLQPGDYITHIDHGVGIFSGLEKIEVNGKLQEAIRLIYKSNDILYVSIHSLHRISKYIGKDGSEPSLNKLGSPAWNNLKKKTKSRVKDIAKDLIKLYAKRKTKEGFRFSPDSYLQNELEASFIYEDTPDQVKATSDVKTDMEKEYPMDRLICGDVGFGKTEIAIRAAFKAVNDSKQVAILVPTTILALQHYHTFSERLADFPCKIDYLNRFRTSLQKKEIIQKTKEGQIDVLIGTHRMVSKDISFKNLGLLIIDEEQKFGVATKEKLKNMKVNVDTLTLTATPIPRTLQFSLMGARDLSLINTPPLNRYPIITELHVFNRDIIEKAIEYEVNRGGQVFFIHNRVQNISEVADMIRSINPDWKVGIGHGQMTGSKLEEVMVDFIDGYFDILVSTSIIESGLDIPNANTIIINNPHYFGLSDLHQMRGRVGRTNKKAFCFLLTPPLSTLTDDARRRLKAIEEFSDLGSGFNIAMRDLDIRGAGNLLGGEQSGFISEIGFEMYHKILDEAINELKNTEFKDQFDEESHRKKQTGTFVTDCIIETDLQLLMPSSYVESTQERLSLYKKLDSIETEEELIEFEKNLADRFGPVPNETQDLLKAIRLRWLATKLGFEKIILKSTKFIGYFISDQESPYFSSPQFSGILSFAQSHPKHSQIRENNSKLSLVVKNIRNIDQASHMLNKMKQED